MITCNTCHILKDNSDFYDSNKSKCKKCLSAYSLEHYRKDRAKWIARTREWQSRNKDKIAAHHKIYNSKWQRDNKDKVARYKNKRRAKKFGARGSYTDEDFRLLCVRYDYKCLKCGIRAEDTPEGTLSADHVIPLCKGGNNNVGNIQPLCLSCNKKKARRTKDYRRF